MTDLLIKERIELERQRDETAKALRVAGLEKDVAVLKTRFDGWLERAVSGEDLKALQREMEEEVNKQLAHICDHLTTANNTQSTAILGEVKAMFARYETKNIEDRLAQSQALLNATAETRREIIRYGIGFALTVLATVIAALIIFWLTGRS
jgi:alanine racemase